MQGNSKRRGGVIAQGIKTPVITPGDDLQEIVISSVAEAIGGKFNDGDIIGVTEAVVAISQGNFANCEDISIDVARKFAGAKELVVIDPIHQRKMDEH